MDTNGMLHGEEPEMNMFKWEAVMVMLSTYDHPELLAEELRHMETLPEEEELRQKNAGWRNARDLAKTGQTASLIEKLEHCIHDSILGLKSREHKELLDEVEKKEKELEMLRENPETSAELLEELEDFCEGSKFMLERMVGMFIKQIEISMQELKELREGVWTRRWGVSPQASGAIGLEPTSERSES